METEIEESDPPEPEDVLSGEHDYESARHSGENDLIKIHWFDDYNHYPVFSDVYEQVEEDVWKYIESHNKHNLDHTIHSFIKDKTAKKVVQIASQRDEQWLVVDENEEVLAKTTGKTTGN